MTSSKELKHQVRQLETRIEFLEEQKRFTLDLLEAASSLGDFQVAIGRLQDPAVILQEATGRIQRLLPMRTQAFYLVDERDSDFKPAFCTPEEKQGFMAENVTHFIDKGIFSWALREKRPVFISGKDGRSRFLLHVLATNSRVRGMFLGVLADKPGEVYDYSLALLSILLTQSANALESFELYKWVQKINQDLEQKVRALAASEQELKRHRLHLEEIVAERTAELSKAVDRLKASLHEKDALIKEVPRRVKSNLRIITDLLGLQAGHTEDGALAEPLRGTKARMRSMARILESLDGFDDFGGIEIKPYLERLAGDLSRSMARGSGVELELDVRNALLDMDVAVPCGLILNELLANSLEHAFAGGRQGRIRIAFDQRGDECGLSVQDDGAGLPEDFEGRSERSLGFQLVRGLVGRIGGSLAIERLAPGTRVTVAFAPRGPMADGEEA